MCPQTSNKGYEVQSTGSNSGTWGDVLNDNMISYVDQNMGGITTLSLSSSNVTLTPSQSRDAMLRCTGTLLANVQITTACIGFFFVENLTSGSFTVTVTNGVSGVAVPQGTRATLIADGTNGVRIASQYLGFVGGTTKLIFNNSTVPTGWTIDAAVTNAALRLLSGSGGGSGGTANFTTAFGARTITASNLPDHTVTITDPGHLHAFTFSGGTVNVAGGSGENAGSPAASQSSSTATTGITAAFGTAARGGAQTTMDFAVKYVDVVRGTLNS